MRNLIQSEIGFLSGGATISQAGYRNLIATVPMGEEIIFNGDCHLTWKGAYNENGDLLMYGEISHGYQIIYSMGSDGVAQYNLIPPTGKKK